MKNLLMVILLFSSLTQAADLKYVTSCQVSLEVNEDFLSSKFEEIYFPSGIAELNYSGFSIKIEDVNASYGKYLFIHISKGNSKNFSKMRKINEKSLTSDELVEIGYTSMNDGNQVLGLSCRQYLHP